MRALFFWCLCALGALLATEPVRAAEPTTSAGAPAAAAPAPTSDGVAAPAAPDDAQQRQDAKDHFLRGIQLAKETSWDAALAEFMASRDLHPTRAALSNAAVCLRNLKRYAEAYAMYNEFLQKFGESAPPDEKAAAQTALGELRAYLGEVDVESTLTGATVVVDGQPQGVTPLPAPIQVNAGTHSVRVSKDGFETFEAQIVVAGKQRKSVSATLRALSRSGNLSVSDAEGRKLSVLIDGAAVGETPWQGALGPGQHSVALRGEGGLGTAPSAATVKEGETVTLSLRAEKLDAELRIEPTPSNARVFLDGVPVGTGVWQGPLKSGAHRVEVMADGHVASSQNVTVAGGKQQAVQVTLERDLSSPIWHAGFVTHPYLEVVGGLAIVPSLNGDAQKACDSKVTDPTGQQVSGCGSHSSSLGPLLGLRGGYEFAKGLGVELFVGYFSSGAKEQRSVVAHGDTSVSPAASPPPGIDPNGLYSSNYKDSTSLKAPFAALSVSYRFLEKTPLTFRVWAGVARGTADSSNSGTFSGIYSAGGAMTPFSAALSIPEVAAHVWLPILGPEARFGLRLNKSLTADLGVAFLWALPGSSPRVGDNGASGNSNSRRGLVTTPGTPPTQVLANLPKEDALGTFLVIAPTAGVRMDF
ncbi:MAG TPA: PEGA domain-containing protein [Polyangiaceae bacterium]